MAIVISGSKHFSRDFVPSGASQGTELWIEFAAAMVSAGWIAVDYSDGATVVPNAVANFAQLDVPNAWQRFRAPTGTMEVVWQRGTNDKYWRAFFDADGYTGGSATVLPTPVGTQFQIVGTVGNFASTWAWQVTGAQAYKWQLCVDSVPSTAGFYYFHMIGRATGTAIKFRRFIFAPLKSGTYSSGDAAPWVALAGSTTPTILSATNWGGWYKKGLVSAALVETLTGNNDGPFPSLGVVDPVDGSHLFQRVLLDDDSGSELQQKGRISDCFWPASSLSVLADGDTLNLATAWTSVAEGPPGALYRYDNILVPFPDGIAPVP